MDLWLLKPGHKIRTGDGAEAEVLSETEDGEWIRVRYLSAGDPSSGGAEYLAHRNKVEVLLGVVHKSTWDEAVSVILHRVPESEESAGGYEAVTMKGVPHGLSITSEDPDSPEEALVRLFSGLKAFGFVGRVAVEDARFGNTMYHREVEIPE